MIFMNHSLFENFAHQFRGGIKGELSEDVKTKVIEHRNRFAMLFYARYMELLPNLIVYRNKEKPEEQASEIPTIAVDFLKVEVLLRNGFDVVIGLTNQNKIQVLGTITSNFSSETPDVLFEAVPLTEKNINFIIPKQFRLESMKEITYFDDCTSGSFVVLRNKTLNYLNDRMLIEHYTTELAEIQVSRFSLTLQSKIMTFFVSNANDETVNQLVTSLYNGSPYAKVTHEFDPNEQMITFENNGAFQNMAELKREYQNKLGELNSMMGVNVLGVDKNSGVSDVEAKSSKSYTDSNANIFLEARNEPLRKLGKRFRLHIEAMYNDVVQSELQTLGSNMMNENNEQKESGERDENDDNIV